MAAALILGPWGAIGFRELTWYPEMLRLLVRTEHASGWGLPFVAADLAFIVLLLSVVGTYSANKNVFDLWVMLGFGLVGYVLHKLEYDLAPFVIALVLAPLLEQSLRQSLAMSPDGAMIFLQRPGTVLMLMAGAVLVALMFRRAKES